LGLRLKIWKKKAKATPTNNEGDTITQDELPKEGGQAGGGGKEEKKRQGGALQRKGEREGTYVLRRGEWLANRKDIKGTEWGDQIVDIAVRIFVVVGGKEEVQGGSTGKQKKTLCASEDGST